MSETLAYIEAYFQNELNENDKVLFEERCATDESFANDVAFYISTRQSLRNELLSDKQSEWEQAAPINQLSKTATVKKINQQQWVRYAAAACVLLIAGLYFLLKPVSPQKLALNYINEQYDHLSQTMSGVEDSMELGKAAYNNKEYGKAVVLFEAVIKRHPENADARQYAGLAYLRQADYDKAIQSFETLADFKGLYSNPGIFLKATAMLLRNKAGDVEKAKLLLQQVVSENLEGIEEAKKLLKKF